MSDWPPPEPTPKRCKGAGCKAELRWWWKKGPREGPSFRVGRWRPPDTDLCPSCKGTKAPARRPQATGPWPPSEPTPKCCAWEGCDVLRPYTWREGPRDGPAWERGRWLAPDADHCPEHQAEHDRQEQEARVQEQLLGSGLPQRLRMYRWDQCMEYRDAGGSLVSEQDRDTIAQDDFAAFQRALPEGVLGITPWNKTLARQLRGICVEEVPLRSWLIMGPVGSGKSTMAAATVAGLLQRGLGCQYITEADLWGMVRAQWGKTTKRAARVPDVVQALIDAPVLVLDDMGTIESPKPWHVDGMERLVCGRYDRERPMLITTNATLGELADIYGERVGSRLVEMIGRGRRYVRLGGPDWRTGRLRPETADRPPPEEPPRTSAQPCIDCGHSPCRCGSTNT